MMMMTTTTTTFRCRYRRRDKDRWKVPRRPPTLSAWQTRRMTTASLTNLKESFEECLENVAIRSQDTAMCKRQDVANQMMMMISFDGGPGVVYPLPFPFSLDCSVHTPKGSDAG